MAPRPNRLGRLDLARQSMRRQGLVSTKRHEGANHAAPCDHFPLLGCNFQTSLQNASALLDEIEHGVRKLLVRCLSWAVPFNVLLSIPINGLSLGFSAWSLSRKAKSINAGSISYPVRKTRICSANYRNPMAQIHPRLTRASVYYVPLCIS